MQDECQPLGSREGNGVISLTLVHDLGSVQRVKRSRRHHRRKQVVMSKTVLVAILVHCVIRVQTGTRQCRHMSTYVAAVVTLAVAPPPRKTAAQARYQSCTSRSRLAESNNKLSKSAAKNDSIFVGEDVHSE